MAKKHASMGAVGKSPEAAIPDFAATSLVARTGEGAGFRDRHGRQAPWRRASLAGEWLASLDFARHPSRADTTPLASNAGF